MAMPGWFIPSLSVWQILDMLENYSNISGHFYFDEK
jgi:hypothetical protein